MAKLTALTKPACGGGLWRASRRKRDVRPGRPASTSGLRLDARRLDCNEIGRDLLQRGFDGVDRLIERRGARGQADGFDVLEPFGPQILWALNVISAQAAFLATQDELARVVGV